MEKVVEFFIKEHGRHPLNDPIGRKYTYNPKELMEFAERYAEHEQRSEAGQLETHCYVAGVDYAELLLKYMSHVGAQEGIDFVDGIEGGCIPFSNDEIKALNILSKLPSKDY